MKILKQNIKNWLSNYKMINDIKKLQQIALTTTQIEFITIENAFDNDNNRLLLPIYPTPQNDDLSHYIYLYAILPPISS